MTETVGTREASVGNAGAVESRVSTDAGSGARPSAARSGRRVRVPGIGAIISILFLLFLVVAAFFPEALTHYKPLEIDPTQALLPPSFQHLFGTDQSGRDVFTRVVYGTSASLSIGIIATALGLVIATALGVAAGLGGRLADGAIGRFLEILFAFPSLLLALLFVTMFGANVTTLVIAVGLGSAPGYARMIRGQVIAIKNAAYVEASYVLGHSRIRVLWRTILPNAMRPLIVLGTLGVGQSIVWASSLSFLGLGAAPPAPEWGAMLAAGRDFIGTAWWTELFPGAIIVGITLATTTLGRLIQRRFEGRTN
ncbi:ABC transporter permease [Gryllotalpicola reticulitermitis]|uniref:ABC transporter permease n=1 Tax=Gryllotalpicola reticulitermitis TaxID=1184153 RepID=A0ABV8QBL1_9MICO